MSGVIKKLAGDTLYYGLSTIVPRLINFILFPIHVAVFAPEEYGVITNLFAWLTIVMALLTYGMETAFFRFASGQDNRESALVTSMSSIIFSTSLFLLFAFVFTDQIAVAVDIADRPYFVLLIAGIIACDVLSAIPFAKLRLDKRPLRFLTVKLINVAITLALNILFLILIPKYGEEFNFIYSDSIGVGYVFFANLIASVVSLLVLIPTFKFKISLFSLDLLKRMLKYGLPIMVVSVVGMISFSGDKILLRKLLPDEATASYWVGVYGANTKLAVLMTLFVQAFRYAFEPFFFAKGGSEIEKKSNYVTIMNYFIAFCLVIFLGVILFLDWFKLLISSEYYVGLDIVPIVLLAFMFMGILTALSLWYKVTDRTYWGVVIASIGATTSVVINVVTIPIWGYVGSAYALLCCYVVMTGVSYLLMRKYYPINYNLRCIGALFVLFGLLYYAAGYLPELNSLYGVISRSVMAIFALFISYVVVNRVK